ncbi:MAG TPA: NAD(P)-dependent oxidoreductase [Anaeromyxobacteraceae bacterium]|nr:NAD(P)-dependent oxidoreductase [Anaeromyxobacteraceae bacterium]
MRILFTGASSFTGAWFVRELAAAGHEVTATFRQPAGAYPDPLRRRRVALAAAAAARAEHGLAFGDDRFLALLAEGRFDLLCHHAAEVTNYRSPDFDALGAAARNAHRLPAVLEALARGGGRRVLLTGSVFEGGEGAGSDGLPDFSPYGLSKALTARLFQFHCRRAGLSLGKLVIPNPFGPWEEARYVAHLVTSWLAGRTPACQTPAYVRDNVHVSLLAKAYARFAAGLPAEPGFTRLAPSGYVESQGAFTLRVAEAMRPRLGLPCPVELREQADFPEPRVRINTDPPDARALGWSEAAAWDELAAWYREQAGR